MASSRPAGSNRKFFSVEEANRTLPLVKMIVADIVRQFRTVSELQQRLTSVRARDRRRPADPYSEEVAQSEAEMELEEQKLRTLIEELGRLGVELKGQPDGLCDFPSLRDGREVYLCWRLGEPEVLHWHELDAGFAGRQPLAAGAAARAGQRAR